MEGFEFVREYSVRVPKSRTKRFHVLSFGSNGKVEVSKSSKISMQRENNLREYKLANDIDTVPKYGAESEYGKELRDEAKRRKYGIRLEEYCVDDQPWIYKQGMGKDARKFKGVKEGQINSNADYYVFMQNKDGVFDAYPIESFYKMYPIGRYKHLSIEEAETEYKKHDKYVDHFQLMIAKRMRREKEQPEEVEVEPRGRRRAEDRTGGNLKYNEDNEALDESGEDSNAEMREAEDSVSEEEGMYSVKGVMEEAEESESDAEPADGKAGKGDPAKGEDVTLEQTSDSEMSYECGDESEQEEDDSDENIGKRRLDVEEDGSAPKRDTQYSGKVFNERLSLSAVEACLLNRPYRFKHLLRLFTRTTPECSKEQLCDDLFDILGKLDVKTAKIGDYRHMYLKPTK